MVNSNNKQSNGLLLNAFGVAKKFSRSGLDLFSHVAPESVAKVTQAFNTHDAIEGSARQKSPFEAKKYADPQQMLREHLPSVSQQLLGRHFNKVNNVAHFVAPQLGEKVAHYFFEQLNQLSNDLSSVDALLNEVGAQDLEELTQDVDRSARISKALAEQNKWLASAQGALSGATGVLGSAVDIPVSMLMALRTIYQVGRAYGFDLNQDNAEDVVQYVFKKIDLSLIAEKQSLLLVLKTVSNILKTHDLQQLQSLLGSNNDFESLKKVLVDADGQFKWSWLNHLPIASVSVLSQISRLAPVAGAGIGAAYSWKLVDDVSLKAQHVFSTARYYLIQHKDSVLSPIEAYEKGMQLITAASPKMVALLDSVAQFNADVDCEQNIIIKDNQQIDPVAHTSQPKNETQKVKSGQEHVFSATAIDSENVDVDTRRVNRQHAKKIQEGEPTQVNKQLDPSLNTSEVAVNEVVVAVEVKAKASKNP